MEETIIFFNLFRTLAKLLRSPEKNCVPLQIFGITCCELGQTHPVQCPACSFSDRSVSVCR